MRTEEILHSPRPYLENYKVILETKNPVSYGRIFSPSSLPPFIKLKLAMINSIPRKDWKSFEHDDTFTELDCYLPPKYITYNPEFKHIGWCVSDSIYVIVMSEDELSELKGISIDPRKESQRESQTHTQRT